MNRILLIVGVGLLVGCHHHSGPASSSLQSSVSGRVLDDRGQPVPGAVVAVVGSATTAATNDHGWFVLSVPDGAQQVEVRYGAVAMCSACFNASAPTAIDLGDLYPGRDSGCSHPVGCPGDRDCDGLPDDVETAGWQVTIVLGDGTEIVRSVTSDPDLRDTDGDGLDDVDEMAARSDPRRRDTDGDGLPDFAELFAYKSNPWMVDSDGDSRGPDGTAVSDPNLWDGYELQFSHTSPTLADTDGDGMTDWEEIHSGGTDPLVADLPRMALDLYGEPSIVLNITDTQTQTQHSIASTLEKDSNNYQRTDTESTRMSIENTIAIHQELEVGTGNWPPSYNAKITADTQFKQGYTTESMSSWTEASVRESQNNYERGLEGHTSVRFDDGRLWTAVRITNDSNLAFRIGDLRIAAQRLVPGGSFETIGTLTLGQLGSSGWQTYEGSAGEFVLGPSGEYIGVVGASELPAQVMRALVSNPTALMFEIGSYSLYKLDQFGNPTVNFAAIGESVIQRTGLLVIDYGNGQVERRMVATNVYRLPDGSGRGVRLGDALDQLGIAHATEPSATEVPHRVLVRVRSVGAFLDPEVRTKRGFWIVGGSGAAFDAPIAVDFDDLVLHSGERINLTYVKDTDGDGIFDSEEYLLGTSPTEPDTDQDGVTDYDETKVGWTVAVQGLRSRDVFSDPRFADRDADYLIDGSERAMGTDPYVADTDGDGYQDAFDPNPLIPPCRDGTPLLLSAWWNGATTGTTANDVWTVDGLANDAAMFAENAPGDIAAALGDDTAFLFNHDGDRIAVTDPPSGQTRYGLSPVHEFSLALRLRYAGPLPTQTAGSYETALTKGPRYRATYAVSIRDTGEIRFSTLRRVYQKRWGWLFGWVDDLAADNAYNELTTLRAPTPVAPNTWVHVVATFGSDAIRLYLDGVQVDAAALDVWQTSGSIRSHWTTDYLVGNNLPLWLGEDQIDAGQPLDYRFNGYLDDVQYFHRALTAEEVRQLFDLGSCAQSTSVR